MLKIEVIREQNYRIRKNIYTVELTSSLFKSVKDARTSDSKRQYIFKIQSSTLNVQYLRAYI